MTEQDAELLRIEIEFWRLRAIRAENMLKKAGLK